MARIYEDPSIRGCAHALILEAMDGINREVREGRSFWVARDSVLSAAADGWVRSYGKEAADRAVRGLHMMAPNEVLDRSTQREALDIRKIEMLRFLADRDPGRNTRLNRAFVRWFGMRLYGLALVAVAASLAFPQPSVARGRQGDAQGDRWRALALCGTLKPGPTRDRACARFGSAERSTVREYDFPADMPRDWGAPRA